MSSHPSDISLPVVQKLCYGVGHVAAEMCVSMWLSYLLVFYQQVLRMDSTLAGSLLLIGQIALALANPFVGCMSDRLSGCCGYGKRKSCHLLGSILVTMSFPFIFTSRPGTDPLEYSVGNNYLSLLYYAPFIIIYQFGFACILISHLALIPLLAHNHHDKVELNSIRYAFTSISNLIAYLVAWLLLTQSQDTSDTESLSPADYKIFRTLALFVIGIGILFVIIFHVGTKEPRNTDTNTHLTLIIPRRMYVLCWLKTVQFYPVAVFYMCTKLIVNVSQVYVSLYVTVTLQLDKAYIGLIPLISFLAAFVIVIPLKVLSQKVGWKIVYCAGLLFVVAACIWYHTIQSDDVYAGNLTIGAAVLNSMGCSTIMVLSLSSIAELIGRNTESAALVYGAMSFGDNLCTGLIIQLIQAMSPCQTETSCDASSQYYRDIITFLPIGLCCLACLLILLIRPRLNQCAQIVETPSNLSLNKNGRSNSYGAVSNVVMRNGNLIQTKSLPELYNLTTDDSVDAAQLLAGTLTSSYKPASREVDKSNQSFHIST